MQTKPYAQMGRFLHEAGAVDPDTGVVYMTEDEGPDGFYRFIPDTSGNLRRGDAADAAGHGPARVQHHHRPDAWARSSVQLGDDRRPQPEQRRGDRLGRVPSGSSRRAARKFLGGEGCTYRDGSARVRLRPTGATPASARSGSTRRPTTSETSTRKASSSCSSSRPAAAVLDGPDNMTHEPRRGDRDRRGRQPERATSCGRCCPTARSIKVAENLVAVQQHYLEASGKLYDPTVPDDGARPATASATRSSPGPRFSPDGEWLFVNIQVPGHHVRDHRRLGEPRPVIDRRGAEPAWGATSGSCHRSSRPRRGRRRATSSSASPRSCTAGWPTRSGRS